MPASSAALTRADIIRYAKADLDEDGDNFWTTSGTDSILHDYANRANRSVYRELLRVNPRFFLTTTMFEWAGGTVSADVTDAGFLTEEPQMIIDVEETPSAGAISESNLPRMVKAMHFIERPMLYRGRQAGLVSASAYSWELQGNTLFIAKVPTRSLNLHVHWVKQLSKFALDADKVLGGFAEPYHDAVASCLAYLMNVKQEGENPEVIRKWQQWREDIRSMASRRRNDGPKHVVKTRWR